MSEYSGVPVTQSFCYPYAGNLQVSGGEILPPIPVNDYPVMFNYLKPHPYKVPGHVPRNSQTNCSGYKTLLGTGHCHK